MTNRNETETPTSSGCYSCGQSARAAPLDDRFRRCTACGAYLPLSRPISQVLQRRDARPAPGFAPGGIVRERYRLIGFLGQGGHAVSYFAEHLFAGHPCVVKVLPPTGAGMSDAAIEALRNEARAGYRVNDPNVVRVLDCDVVSGTWYFVMEYVDGADLGLIVSRDFRMPWRQVAQTALDAARGVDAIHRQQLLHRDIKPGNLLLGIDGRVRVADLGVARLAYEEHRLGKSGGPELVGTLTYAAPEMFVSGAPVGPASDLYSLGATLFHLLVGRPPHDTGQVFRRLIDVQTRPVTWPADAPADVPRWFVELLLRLVAIEPGDRPADAPTLIAALQSASGDEPIALPAARPATVAGALEPRGVSVLPFINETGDPDHDWVGQSIADYLWRRLSDVPEIYIVAQDVLATMLERLGTPDGIGDPELILEAGRRVGARTIICGRYERQDGALRVSMELLRAGAPAARVVARLERPLADFDQLEQELHEQLLTALGLRATAETEERPDQRPTILAARERFAQAKLAFLRGDYDEAAELALKADALAPGQVDAIGFVGVCYARLGRYDEAEQQHQRQLDSARRRNDVRLEAETLANLGVMEYFRGQYEQAEGHLERAARLAQERRLSTEHAQICNNLGFVLLRRGRLAEAAQAFLRAIDTHRAYGGLTSLVGPYNGLGNVLVQQQRYDEARTYYREALAFAGEVGDRASVGTTHTHLGHCALLQERFADAQHEFTMALNALEETRFWNGLARVYEYLADMNLRLANYDEAERCADKRIDLARQHANTRMEAAAWEQKAELLQRVGRAEEAADCRARGEAIGAHPPAGN